MTPVVNTRNQERGSESLQTAIVVPLLLLAIFTAVQAGLYYVAVSTAQSAAAACAESARLLTASSGSGTAAANQVLASAGSLESATVSASRGDTTTTCTVTGKSHAILGSLSTIGRTVQMPTERITRP